jgi:hypothetical protein
MGSPVSGGQRRSTDRGRSGDGAGTAVVKAVGAVFVAPVAAMKPGVTEPPPGYAGAVSGERWPLHRAQLFPVGPG